MNVDDNDLPIEQAFIDVHYAEPAPPEYVINELLPVGLTVMSGPPKKAFKSLQSLLFAATAAGWSVPNLPCWMEPLRTGPSLLISYEAQAGVVNYILNHDCGIKTKPGYLYVAHAPFKFQLDNDAQANELLEYMDAKQPIITVMDPFRNMHSGDENDSGEVMRLLTPLVEWFHETKSAGLLIHHVNKPTEGKDKSSYYSMRGSSALPGIADGLITIEDTKSEGDIWLNATFKRGLSYRRQIHIGVPGFGWGGSGYEILPSQTKQVCELINQGHNTEEVIKLTKQTRQQVLEAIKDLQRNRLLIES